MKTAIIKTMSALLLLMTFSIGVSLAECREVALADSPNETLEAIESLDNMLLRPLGIEQSIGRLETSEIESDFKRRGFDYRKLDIGAYGTVIALYPTNFDIGGVGISRIIFIMNEYAKMAMYESVPSTAYPDVCKAIEDNLNDNSIRKDMTNDGNTNLSTFMLSDSVGISVGSIPERQISVIYLMDMDNLKGFLNQR
ncbi:MAG: hypothetical protein K2H71_12965 [Muribaculaceae bacterium]|nr:hypothetical protein [Muribaculaceae bacterium]